MNSRKDYPKALALRLQGKTYGEIRSIFGIPKSTQSCWFSKLKISQNAQKILKSKRKNGYYKLLECNKIRTEKIKEENESIRKEYEFRIDKISSRELMILGATLYWGEGYKNFNLKKGAYPYVSFSNSDPQMIIVFIDFLEKIIGISKNAIKAQVLLYPNLDPRKSVNYWQKITNIPRKNFRFQIALSRASQGKRPKHLLPYGTLQLRIIRRREFFKIRGLIDGIIKGII